MTMTAERPRYVARRRFADRPAAARVARHRRPEPLLVVVLASLAHFLRAAGRAAARNMPAIWAARTVTRAAVVVAVSAFLLAAMLFGSVLVMVEPLRSEPHPMFVTPSPR